MHAIRPYRTGVLSLGDLCPRGGLWGGLCLGGSLFRGLSVWGVSVRDLPRQRPHQKEQGTRDRDPLEGTWDQASRQEVTSYGDPPPVVIRTDAGGKYPCSLSLLLRVMTMMCFCHFFLSSCVNSNIDNRATRF